MVNKNGKEEQSSRQLADACDAVDSNQIDLTLITQLIRKGADVNFKDSESWSPLLYASSRGHWNVVDALLKQSEIDVNQAATDGTTSLLLASQQGHRLVVGQLLKQSSIDVNQARNGGFNPLYIASENGHELVVRHLLLAKADVYCVASNGDTAITAAGKNGHDSLVYLLKNQHLLSHEEEESPRVRLERESADKQAHDNQE